MPRFYFDITEDGETFRDEEGVALSTAAEVRDAALDTLPTLAKGRIRGDQPTRSGFGMRRGGSSTRRR